MKRSFGWLNFLYTFFGFEIVFKGSSAIGTLRTLMNGSGDFIGESLLSKNNLLTIMTMLLVVVEVIVKLYACLTHKKKEGFFYMKCALVVGMISSVVYMFVDRGITFGIGFMIIAVGFMIGNMIYVNNREWVYGNPDLL